MSDPVLTVAQEHLLKRELLRLQLTKESEALDNMVNIDQLGSPFILPNGKVASGKDYPLTAYILRHFVRTFPLLAHAEPDFWQKTAQPFVQGLASKDISSSADRDEATKRRRIGRVVKRLLLLFFVAGVGSNREKLSDRAAEQKEQESLQQNVDEQIEKDIDNMVANVSVQDAPLPVPSPMDALTGAYGAVLGVREVSSSGFIRNKTHSEYIIECFVSRGSMPNYVARSWAEFVELSRSLSLEFPSKKMPRLPRKTLKNTVTKFKGEERELLREPQRVTLRDYIHKLCQIPHVVHSDIFLDFLFNRKIELGDEERSDIEARIALDQHRIVDKQHIHELIRERETKLSSSIATIKDQILLEDALPQIFKEIKSHRRVEDMSPLIQNFVEWCLVQFAGVIYDLLIARDGSPEMFSQLKRLHNLMPYAAIRGILKLSNPALVLKKLTDLFMATPFGSQSLVQQMFIRILTDDMNTQEKMIVDVQKRLDESDLVKALEDYIAEDHYSRVALQQRAAEGNVDLILEIARTYLPRARAKEVSDWHARWQAAVNETQGSIDEDPYVEKYSVVKDLLKLKIMAHDKDVMREFWGDPQTIKFIREIVNLTYDVFIDIFRYANVSESFGDFQKFMNDIIACIDYATTEVVLDNSQVVDSLLKVLQTHQNAIFKFVNRVYSRDVGFFVDLVEWFSLFVSFIQMRKKDKGTSVDLLSLVSNSKTADPAKVAEELQALNSWLEFRKETCRNSETSLPTSSDDFPVVENFEISDVGLSWEDVDFGLAEVEQDNFEEFLPEQSNDMTKDQVTIEKRRRRKLAEMEARRAQLKPRPEMKETAKLLPDFEAQMFAALANAVPQKTILKNL